MPSASGSITASFAVMLGMSGPTTVPAAMSASAWPPKRAGNFRSTASAMRSTRPLFFMPSPRPNAPSRIHQMESENAANTVGSGTAATVMNSTAMMSAVTTSGSTPNTHHAMAHTRMPSVHAAWNESPSMGANAHAMPAATPMAAPIRFLFAVMPTALPFPCSPRFASPHCGAPRPILVLRPAAFHQALILRAVFRKPLT